MHSRSYRRVHQACENCRRKKTRCPGEKPACSSCTRLSKTCQYPDGRGESLGSETRQGDGSVSTERRLAQLEARIRMMERQGPSSDSESPTKRLATWQGSQDWQMPPSPRTEMSVTSSVSLLPPREVLDSVVKAYFLYCHKQPLWLFDPQDFSSLLDCQEETLFSLLAASSCHSEHPFFQGRLDELSRVYAQTAKVKIMQRIGEGQVSLSTIQNLCLLALANLQADNPTLVCLHVSMAMTLSKCGNLEFETCSQSDHGLRAESRRRVYWSLHLLQHMYGHQTAATNILEDVSRPQYVARHVSLLKELDGLPPAIPREDTSTTQGEGGSSGLATPKKVGVWVHMIQLSTLWGEVRTYVKHWAQQINNVTPPWSIDSGYTAIGAKLMDMETKFPARHRFDLARFPDQDHQSLQSNRGYWSPWLYQQFTYHTIHNMLNHPFLYSSRPHQSDQLGVPNTFWKTSSELAFLHSTWVARLIDMVVGKGYRVSDPFIGHCAAIAATIQIYFCRAADKTTRQSALNRLGKCVAFLGELALLWPSCRWLHEKLQALVRSAFAVDDDAEERRADENPTPPRTISINTRLMWDILLYNLGTSSSSKTMAGSSQKESLFDESFTSQDDNSDEGEDIIEMDNFHNPTVEVTLSNGQALPPQSGQRKGRAGRGLRARSLPNQQQQQQDSDHHDASMMTEMDVLPVEHVPVAAASWPMSLDMAYDPFFQFHDPSSPFPGTWDVGNL